MFNPSRLHKALAAHLGQELTPEVATRIAAAADDIAPSDESDIAFARAVMQGDEDAVQFCLDVARVTDTWDNLVDADKPVTADQVNDMALRLLFGIRDNPFFRRHEAPLSATIRAGVLNWQVANRMQRMDHEARVQAHVLRYTILDVVLMSAYLIGGQEWAVLHGPEIRRRSMRDTLSHFLQECAAKDGEAAELGVSE